MNFPSNRNLVLMESIKHLLTNYLEEKEKASWENADRFSSYLESARDAGRVQSATKVDVFLVFSMNFLLRVKTNGIY